MNKFDLEERLINFSVLIIEITNEIISIFVKSDETAQSNLKKILNLKSLMIILNSK